MSIQAVAWVLDQSRSRGFARLVLIAIANHHNRGTGQCNPGQRLIAREAGISPGSVSAQIRTLVGLGELEVVSDGTSHRSAEYRLPFMEPDEVRAAPARSALGTTREVRAAAERSTRDNGATTRGPGPRGTVEPTTEPLTPNPPTPLPASLTLAGVAVPDAVHAIFAEWQRATDHPRAQLDAKRRRAIAAALKSYPVEDCLDAVRGVTLFEHNMGATTGRKYDDVTLVLRDAEHVERFRDAWRGEGQTTPKDRLRADKTFGATAVVLERMQRERAAGGNGVGEPPGALPAAGR